jgi:hypothetical protein
VKLAELLGIKGAAASSLRTGTVAAVLADGRYRLTDPTGRQYEVRSAATLRLGEQVLHQDGVVVRTAGQARAVKVFYV